MDRTVETLATFGRREVVDEESLMADLCTASADEETINRLTRDILMMKLKKVDMRRHVFEVQCKPLDEPFEVSLISNGEDICASVLQDSSSGPIEVELAYINKTVHIVFRQPYNYERYGKSQYTPVHVSVVVYASNRPVVHKDFLEMLIRGQQCTYWHELVTVDDKAVANGTFSCEAIVKVKPVRLCIETLDTKAKMLQLLHSPKPVADDDSEGKSSASAVTRRRTRCSSGQISRGFLARWLKEFRSGRITEESTGTSPRDSIRLHAHSENILYTLWSTDKKTTNAKSSADRSTPDSGVQSTGSDGEAVDEIEEGVEATDEDVLRDEDAVAKEVDESLVVAPASSPASLSSFVSESDDQEVRSPPSKRPTPERSYDGDSEASERSDKTQRADSEPDCFSFRSVRISDEDDHRSPQEIMIDEFPGILEVD